MATRTPETGQAYPKTAAGSHTAWTLGAVAAGAGAAVVLGTGPAAAAAAVRQSWSPFALVCGLILVGRTAAGDGVFAATGSRIAALGGGPARQLLGMLALVALVTVVLNLDTAVVFLTPVLIHAARSRRLDERPFVYGAVFMSNSASLLLPGSNLTNLIVLGGQGVPALEFARLMLLPWLAAALITGALTWLLHRRTLRAGSDEPGEITRVRGRSSLAAIAAVSLLVLVARNPALPVLLLGLGLTAWRAFREREPIGSLPGLVPRELAVLFSIAVALNTLARLVSLPPGVAAAGPLQSAVLGSIAAVAMNNLPAAALLSAHPPAHPLFLLLGLDLGPNLFISGSLSAVLWIRVARQSGAVVSARRYAQLGLIITPVTLFAACALLSLGGHMA